MRRSSSTRDVVLSLLFERVLDLEEVGEVAAGLDTDGEVDRLVVVVEDRDRFMEAVADRTLADHRELRVDVDRPRAGHEEEARLEVLQVVDGERVEPLRRSRSAPSVERKRVSNENRPVGSVSDASMSPRASLTTKVFPSRILTSPSLITASSHCWRCLAGRVNLAVRERAAGTPGASARCLET